MKNMSAAAPSVNTRVGTLDRANPATPPGSNRPGSGTEFLSQLQALQSLSNAAVAPQPRSSSAGAPGALRFSNHAIDRMQSRGIAFSPDQMAKIQSAVEKAASKGAKDTLLLTDDSALIVSVKDKMVVTVMDKASLKENVFTNIDSTVMI